MSNTKEASLAFINAIKICNLKKTSRERVNYLGGTACLNLVENLITGWAQCVHKKMWVDSINNDVTAENMRTIVTNYIRSVENLIDIKKSSSKNFNSLADFVSEVTNEPIDDLQIIPTVTLNESVLDELIPNSTNYDGSCIQWFDNLKLEKMIGLCLFAAIRFNQEGLYYHASVAYLKTLGICSALLAIVPISSSIPYIDRSEFNERTKRIKQFSRKLISWRLQIIKLAFKSITASNANGFVELIRSYGTRNVNEPSQKWKDEFNFHENHIGTAGFLKNYPHYSEEGRIEILFGHQRKRGKEIKLNEPWCWIFSPMGERTVFFGIWSIMLTRRLTEKNESGYPDIELDILQKDIGALSSRGMLFSHWLAGRRLVWTVINTFKQPLKTNEIKACLKNAETWNLAARAIYNLDRANYYMRQLSGNNQEISIPSSLHIFFDMWELLYTLTDAYAQAYQFNDMHDNFKTISGQIEKYSHSIVNPSHFNLRFVTDHAVKYAQDIEQIPDISSRVRQNIVRNKYFLADDYEDPRFHLDWSLTHLFSPIATIMRLHIQLSMAKLNNKF